MRFLCLHGYATCVDVLKEMMEPIIEHLPSHWEYEYLEADMECSKLMIPTMDQIPPPNYSWHNYPYPQDVHNAHERIVSFVESEGPFDGIWGFSQGGAMAALMLLMHQKLNPDGQDWPFKMAIFNSAFLPYRLDSGLITWDVKQKDELQGTYEPGEFDASGGREVDWMKDPHTTLDYLMIKRVQQDFKFPAQLLLKYQPEDVPENLTIPSVHVWGVKDEYFFVDDSLSKMFGPDASKMTHRGGHHFPRFPDELVHFAELIIETASTLP
ncbi:hypothetical protein N7478_002815 [Penicillium angulare]|uniref:uncharacterized protein n=1 Tax=Penicillium angulare TaxID=116970 RepID=UPI00254149D3|nr:uncharacterized protein N7478_002815 [Penicillium angulare]KAJ5287129.1 hypothetical protein N7478_002815 [Penicillium angulare]